MKMPYIADGREHCYDHWKGLKGRWNSIMFIHSISLYFIWLVKSYDHGVRVNFDKQPLMMIPSLLRTVSLDLSNSLIKSRMGMQFQRVGKIYSILIPQMVIKNSNKQWRRKYALSLISNVLIYGPQISSLLKNISMCICTGSMTSRMTSCTRLGYYMMVHELIQRVWILIHLCTLTLFDCTCMAKKVMMGDIGNDFVQSDMK